MLALCAVLRAQTGGPTYTIAGRVSLPDGNPAVRVTVTITSQKGVVRQVMTDDLGQFELAGAPSDIYTLTAVNPAAPEEHSDRATVELSRLSPPRVSVNIYLRTGTKVEERRESTATGVTVAEAAQHVPKAAQREYERGIKSAEAQQFDKALKSLDRAIQLFPEYFQAYAQRGHVRVAMGQIEEAKKDFARALELDSQFEPALRGTGICKIREGNYAGALKDLDLAVAKEPRDASAYLFLGFANLALDRRAEARAALQKALQLDPAGSARAHVHLANLDLKEDRNQEAAAELEAYLAAVPNAPDAAKLRALLAQIRQNQAPK